MPAAPPLPEPRAASPALRNATKTLRERRRSREQPCRHTPALIVPMPPMPASASLGHGQRDFLPPRGAGLVVLRRCWRCFLLYLRRRFRGRGLTGTLLRLARRFSSRLSHRLFARHNRNLSPPKLRLLTTTVPTPAQGRNAQLCVGLRSPAELASNWNLRCRGVRPRRLARLRTPAFHAGNTGSNPVGDVHTTTAHRRRASPGAPNGVRCRR